MPTVSVPIIDQLIHPSIGLLSVAFAGVFSNDTNLVPPQGPLALTYGVKVDVFTAPVEWSRKVGNPGSWFPPFATLSVTYLTLDNIEITLQEAEIDVDGTCYFWSEALPSELLVHIEPGWDVVISWLQT